jgi:hypothetical protein
VSEIKIVNYEICVVAFAKNQNLTAQIALFDGCNDWQQSVFK